eukprot:5608250-Heterocapsa_arctica.AAC.1
MNKMTDGLQSDSGDGNSQTQEHVLHILCKHRTKEKHHDTKWKYRKKCKDNHSDTEEVHKSMAAETIDLRKRDSTKDSNKLADDKYKKKGTIHFCAQGKNGERDGYSSVNYKKWKYKRRRGHTKPETGHRILNGGLEQTTYCGTKAAAQASQEIRR